MTTKLTLQDKVARLRDFYRKEKRIPSYSEMLSILNFRSKNAVFELMEKLVELGYVRKSRQGKISFTSKMTGAIKLLGAVQAGFPSPAEEELVDTLSLDDFLVARPDATFMLTVSGDSMIDAGIHPGDIVLIEKGKSPRPNDIIIANVDGEWTLKFFGKDRKGVYLDPANREYRRIRPRQTLEIGGVVKAVIRKYG